MARRLSPEGRAMILATFLIRIFLLVAPLAATLASAAKKADAPAPARGVSAPSKDHHAQAGSDSSAHASYARVAAPDQALYRKEYVLRRAFPDTILDLIPGLELFKTLRDSAATLPFLRPESVAPCRWTVAGPTNVPGRVTGIAVTKQASSPGTPRVIVTTVGGVWRSMDGARRWERVSDGLRPGVFGAVAVTPNAPDEVFVGGGDPNYRDVSRAGGPGIWSSGSGGAPGSWQLVSPPELDDAVVFRLAIDPAPPHHVYAATSKGVYRGDRSGTAIVWSRLRGQSANGFDAPTSDIVIDFPAGGTPVVYAGAYDRSSHYQSGIWKFTGAPTTGRWTRRSDGISALSGVIHLAMAESRPTTLYAKISNKADNSLLGIFKTTTGGESASPSCTDPTLSCTWCSIERQTPGGSNPVDDASTGDYLYDDYDGAIVVHPTNPEVVFVGNLKLYWTDTGCAPWFDLSNSLDVPDVHLHEDQHALAFDPEDPNKLWVGGDGSVFAGVFRKVPDTGFGLWDARSHGMATTEFWGVGTQQAEVTPLLGGMQDNGTGVTYGNRTWYARHTCDGAQAALDAKNSVTVYESCNGNLEVIKTVLPGFLTDTWGERPRLTQWPEPRAPLAVDVALAGHMLDAGLTGGGDPCIATSTNARSWLQANVDVPKDMEVSCIAIAPPTASGCGTPPATPFSDFYVGLRSREGKPPRTEIRYLHAGTPTWHTALSGIPKLSPNAIAVDPCDPTRAFAAFGGDRGRSGKVEITEDGGASWIDLPFPPTLPPAPATGVAIDPYDRSVIYAATAVGVRRGSLTFAPQPSCDWVRFDEGLPAGPSGIISVDASSIAVDAETGTLVLGTFGYGAFQRDIHLGHVCAPTVLSIRDNVFDRGDEPSPSGEPDPEHPVCANPSCDTYEPDGSSGGTLEWWDSPDIRVDLPCPKIPDPACPCGRDVKEPAGDPPDGALDAVEVESCPTEVWDCPMGMMRDRNPTRGCTNRVYVQVTNRGFSTGHNLRVTAIWTDATTGLPVLPPTFWSSAFPATGRCQPVDESTGWHPLDPAHPCQEITALEADRPQVVYFDWHVPGSAPAHSCILAMVDSPDDPIPSSIRGVAFAPWEFVPQTHQIGLRNLHIVDSANMLTRIDFLDSLSYRNPSPSVGGQGLVISRAQLESGDTVGVLLPRMHGGILSPVNLTNVDAEPARLTATEKQEARALGLDTTVVYQVRDPVGGISGFAVPRLGRWRVGLLIRTAGVPRKRLAPRFTVMATRDSVVLGGSTYLLRFRR
jgi:hypothetical protein